VDKKDMSRGELNWQGEHIVIYISHILDILGARRGDSVARMTGHNINIEFNTVFITILCRHILPAILWIEAI